MTGTSIATSSSRRRWLRVAGAVLGGSLATVAAALSYWLDLYWWGSGIGPIALIGVVVGIGLGFAAGPAAVTTTRPWWFAFAQSANAALLGLALLVAGFLASGGGWVGQTDLASSAILIVYIVYLALIALPLALPVTLPIALISVGVLRLTQKWPRVAALGVVAAVLLAVAMTTAAVLVARPALEGAASGPFQVEWTIANYSSSDFELSVWSKYPADGSISGSSQYIGPCFTTTGRTSAVADWFLTLQPLPAEPLNAGTPPALVSATEVPGPSPRVWITIGADGVTSVDPGRGAPPTRDLTVDYCATGSQP
ncbi:MAG: hypothetical protein ACRDF7_04490 [Candidatus Limnocylindrales bacterium]